MGDMADYGLEFIDTWPSSRTQRFRRTSFGKLVTCKYCGGKEFHWAQFSGAWRLANPGGTIHECPAFKRDSPDAKKAASGDKE